MDVVATLGYAVDARSVVTAATDLDKMNAAANRAATGAEKVAASTNKMAAANRSSVQVRMDDYVARMDARYKELEHSVTATAQQMQRQNTVLTETRGRMSAAEQGISALARTMRGFAAGAIGGLVVAALDLAIGKAVEFVGSIVNGSNTMEATLKRHKELVDEIRDAYKGASEEEKRLGLQERNRLLVAENLKRRELEEALTTSRQGISRSLIDIAQSHTTAGEQLMFKSEGGAETVRQMNLAVNKFLADMQAGRGSALELSEQVNALALAAPKAADATNLYAQEISASLAPLIKAERQMKESDAAIALLNGTASDNQKQMIGVSDSLKTASQSATHFRQSIIELSGQFLQRLIPPGVNTWSGWGGVAGRAWANMRNFKPISGKSSILDLIGFTEGTDRRRGYNEVLGYGRYGGGDAMLTQMSINQAMALGEMIRQRARVDPDPRQRFNSSAIGRYQFTASTIRELMGPLGLSGNEIFSAEMQDKLALALINKTGGSLAKLKGRWPSLPKVSDATILGALGTSRDDLSGVAENSVKARADSIKKQEALQRDLFEAAKKKQDAADKTRAQSIKAQEEAQKDLFDAHKQFANFMDEENQKLTDNQTVLKMTASEAERYTKKQEYLNKAKQLGIHLDPQQIAGLERTAKGFGDAAAQAESLQEQIARMDEMRGTMRDFLGTFAHGLLEGKKATEALSDTLKSLASRLLDRALDGLTNALFGAQGTPGGGLFGSLFGGLFGSANGNVFANGTIQPFASGGIVNGPTLFPMRNGTGLMGEAGPEAIMPLRRGRDGKLGVASEGRSISVTMNIHGVTDAASFAKSKNQIASELSRLVSMGNRYH